jgi:hypothetical protein
VERDVIHIDLVLSGLQIERQFLPYYGEILVIDGEGGLRRLRENTAAESNEADEASDHKATPPREIPLAHHQR